MPVLAATGAHIAYAAQILREGRLAAFPTETVYGLGADAFNPEALARLFEVKRRPRFDPLIVHIAHMDTLKALVDFSTVPSATKRYMDALTRTFWPGPLTLVLPKCSLVPGLVTAGLPSIAVRFPDNAVALRLIEEFGGSGRGALAAPSANPFGYLSPTRAEHVAAQLGRLIPVILDGGPCRIGVESTVLDLSGPPRILRPGGVTMEALRAVIPAIDTAQSPCDAGSQASPGMLKSHYAPHTPLYLHDSAEMAALPEEPDCAYLRLEKTLQESAARLFEKLHALDGQGYAAIHAELAPETGLGLAINDRLKRAANAALPDRRSSLSGRT